MNKRQRTWLNKWLEKHDNVNTANGCSEPGYDDKPVILANWNNIPQEEFDKLESMGFSCEWEDEWLTCGDCGKAFRCQPNSYGWEMYGIIGDGDCTCGDCIDMQEYLESIENHPTKALTCSLLDAHKPIEQYGYRLIQDDYENGWYPGQNDDPKKILASLLQKNPTGKYIFTIDGQGQFDISFSVYERIVEPDNLENIQDHLEDAYNQSVITEAWLNGDL